MAKKSKRRFDTLPVLHPDAAGIDVGASELYVAVSADRDPHPVRSFPTFTRDAIVLEGYESMVGNGDAMSVASQVVENMFGATEGWLCVDDPVLLAELPEEVTECAK